MDDARQFLIGVEFKDAPRARLRTLFTVHEASDVHKTRHLRFARGVADDVPKPDAGVVPVGRHGAVVQFNLQLVAQLVGGGGHVFPEPVGGKGEDDARNGKHAR